MFQTCCIKRARSPIFTEGRRQNEQDRDQELSTAKMKTI